MTDDHNPVSLIDAPSGYADWLIDLKSRIHSAQQRAALAGKPRIDIAILANRQGYSGTAGPTRLGCQGYRAAIS
jgi:hypothetical protein